MLLHTKLYWPETITAILWYCGLKKISEELNEFNVDDDVIIPMEEFETSPSKTVTHGDAQYVSWIQVYKAT